MSQKLQHIACAQFQVHFENVSNGKHVLLVPFQVTHVSLVLIAKDYNPEKYEDLSKILTKQYCRTGEYGKLLSCFLCSYVIFRSETFELR